MFSLTKKTIISGGIAFVMLILLSFFSINPNAFSFPINVICLVVLVYLSLIAGRFSERFRFFSSSKTAFFTSSYIIFLMIVHWLFHHRKLFSNSIFPDSLYDFSTSALFIISWMFFLFVLGAVIVSRLTVVKKNNLVFLLNHIGLWVVLAAGFFGRADSYTLQTMLVKDYMVSQAYTSNNQAMNIPFDIGLKKIQADFYPSGEAKSFVANIVIGEKQMYKMKEISVNHPYRYQGYDIYLLKAGVNTCTLQIVYDPWRYIVLIGIVCMMVGAIGMFFLGFKKSNIK